VNISAARLDDYVQQLWFDAMLSNEPHVMAVATGDDRYRKAVTAVEDARRDLEEYRDDLTFQRELGTKLWAEGLKPRKEALRLAQETLAKIPPPAKVKVEDGVPTSLKQSREMNRRYVDRVEVKPGKGRGVRTPVADRVDVFFVGAIEPYRNQNPVTIEDFKAALDRAASAN
jgi:hypothetical protein